MSAVHVPHGLRSKHINAFDEVEQFSEYGSRDQMHEENMTLPYSIFDRQPLVTEGNRFLRNGIPFDIHSDGVYVNKHKVDYMPIIVEKEVIKHIYLTPTNPISAAINAFKHWRNEVANGNQLYQDQFGQVHIKRNHDTEE